MHSYQQRHDSLPQLRLSRHSHANDRPTKLLLLSRSLQRRRLGKSSHPQPLIMESAWPACGPVVVVVSATLRNCQEKICARDTRRNQQETLGYSMAWSQASSLMRR